MSSVLIIYGKYFQVKGSGKIIHDNDSFVESESERDSHNYVINAYSEEE